MRLPIVPALADVVAAYPPWVAHASIETLGNLGGFSGACIHRLSSPLGVFCLRASASGEAASRVLSRHALVLAARAAGLDFVPRVLPTRAGATLVERAGRCWELMPWMPGRADFHATPSFARLCAAAEALARLHLVWQRPGLPLVGVCPGVKRRLDAVESLPRIDPFADPLQHELAFWLPQVPALLANPPRVPLQPVLRDIWHDHLLFEGDCLTGLIDYASVGLDSVAVDLARLIGSLVEDNEPSWQFALAAYRRLRPVSTDEEGLARALDRAGVIAALGNWHRWLRTGQRDLALPSVRARVERLVTRVAQWPRTKL